MLRTASSDIVQVVPMAQVTAETQESPLGLIFIIRRLWMMIQQMVGFWT
jgi:hypothetical protein